MVRKRQCGHVGFDKREWSYLLFEGLDGPPSAHWLVELILALDSSKPRIIQKQQQKVYYSLPTNGFEGIFSGLLYYYS